MRDAATTAPDEPRRILYVHHRSELGGAPSSLAYLIRALDRTEWEPHVYCPPGPAAEMLAAAGATVHTGPVSAFTHIWASTYQGRRWLLFARELLLLGPHLARLAAVLRSERFAIVHLNDSPLVFAALLVRRKGIPIVWHLRSALPGDDRRARFLRRLIARTATATVAINDDVATSFSLGSEVIPNVVDLARFSPGDPRAARERLGLPTERPLVSFFGFVYPSKGFREFVELARALRTRGLEATFVMVGGAVRGEPFFRTLTGRVLELSRLARNYDRIARELIAELDLQDNFVRAPFTSATEDYYRASDVVVAPSRGPELGRPVIEAAASGVPAVATGSHAGGGVLLDGETGLLVDDYSVDGMADAVESLLRDDERRTRIGATARAHAERTFSPEAAAGALQALYRRLSLTTRAPGRAKVLFVHHRPQLGGAPTSLALLIRHLDRDVYEPHAYVPEGEAAELFRRSGATVHTGPVAIFKHSWDAPYAGVQWLTLAREAPLLLPHARRFSALLRRERFDLVHLNDSPLLPAAWLAHRKGAKVVWHLRSALWADGRDRRSRAIARLMTAWGSAAVAIDGDVAATFHLGLPVTVIHNSVEPVTQLAADEAKRALGLPLDRTVVGFAGFVRRMKGWPELVLATEILVREGVPVHVAVFGGGVRPSAWFKTGRGRLLEAARLVSDEESAIRRLIAERGLENHFTLFPFDPNPSRLYAAVDVMTFPNQGVGLGRPVLEAAAHGRAVVASGSRTGAGILIPDETGLLLDDGTPERLAEALRRLIGNPELRVHLGEQALEYAQTAFDPELAARRLENVYSALIGVPARSADVAAKAI
jgi:glycosyltransferase involved in cell wall biosynthesis